MPIKSVVGLVVVFMVVGCLVVVGCGQQKQKEASSEPKSEESTSTSDTNQVKSYINGTTGNTMVLRRDDTGDGTAVIFVGPPPGETHGRELRGRYHEEDEIIEIAVFEVEGTESQEFVCSKSGKDLRVIEGTGVGETWKGSQNNEM